MGAAEMAEIADIIVSVLGEVTPASTVDESGSSTVSKAKFTVSDQVTEAARKRSAELLAGHPLYPEIDLDVWHTAPQAR
jgi:glycine hydroxymethyltransferase